MKRFSANSGVDRDPEQTALAVRAQIGARKSIAGSGWQGRRSRRREPCRYCVAIKHTRPSGHERERPSRSETLAIGFSRRNARGGTVSRMARLPSQAKTNARHAMRPASNCARPDADLRPLVEPLRGPQRYFHPANIPDRIHCLASRAALHCYHEPLTQITEVLPAPPEGGSMAASALDRPRPAARPTRTRLDLRGWVVGRGGSPVASVLVLRDGGAAPAAAGRASTVRTWPPPIPSFRGRNGAGSSGRSAPSRSGPGSSSSSRCGSRTGRRLPLALVRGTRAPLRSSFEPRLQPLAADDAGPYGLDGRRAHAGRPSGGRRVPPVRVRAARRDVLDGGLPERFPTRPATAASWRRRGRSTARGGWASRRRSPARSATRRSTRGSEPRRSASWRASRSSASSGSTQRSQPRRAAGRPPLRGEVPRRHGARADAGAVSRARAR